jgi:hypothetical protein
VNDICWLSEAERIEFVKRNGLNIKYIENPTKELQLIAVRDYGFTIKYIVDASEEVQIEAVRNFYYVSLVDLELFVEMHIKSEKARELFNKMIMVREIIK